MQNIAFEKRVPFEATVELTYGCNLRCAHCYNPTHLARKELTTEEFFGIIDQLAQEGCLSITFTGGELFTRRDAFPIIEYAKRKGFWITLFTNATRITPEIADQIKALQIRKVEVSIYGATSGTYERVTQIPGSFQCFMRGVELLRERRVPLLIKMPVMTLNQPEVIEAKTLVEGWGIKFIYCTQIDPRQDGSPEPLRYRISPQDVVQLDQEILGERHQKGSQEKNCDAHEGLFPCKCGKSSFAITPYGEMNLCISFPVPRYNLRTGNVSSGWKVLKDYVDSARPSDAYECPGCDLKRYCRRGPADAWFEKGDVSGACLPYFKELAGLEKFKVRP